MSFEVRPDMLYRLNINGNTEIQVSRDYDYVVFFRSIGAAILKYWHSDKGCICNILMTEEMGETVLQLAPLRSMEDDGMSTTEHEQIVGWRAEALRDEDFDLGDIDMNPELDDAPENHVDGS